MVAGELVGLIERIGFKGIEDPTFLSFYRSEISRVTTLAFDIKLASELTGEIARIVKDGRFLTVFVARLSYTFTHRFAILLEVLLPPLLASQRVDLLMAYGDAAPVDFDGLAMSGSCEQTLLIPDIYFIRFRGYEVLKREIDQGLRITPEPDFSLGCYWRGSATGHRAFSPSGTVTSQRIELCRLSKRVPNIVNARLTGLTDIPEELREGLRREGIVNESFASPVESLIFPIQIDLDGWGNAYSSFFWKLYSNRLTIKVGSPLNLRQWFYRRLTEGIHYLPADKSLVDLVSVVTDLLAIGKSEYWDLASSSRKVLREIDYENEVRNSINSIITYIEESPEV